MGASRGFGSSGLAQRTLHASKAGTNVYKPRRNTPQFQCWNSPRTAAHPYGFPGSEPLPSMLKKQQENAVKASLTRAAAHAVDHAVSLEVRRCRVFEAGVVGGRQGRAALIGGSACTGPPAEAPHIACRLRHPRLHAGWFGGRPARRGRPRRPQCLPQFKVNLGRTAVPGPDRPYMATPCLALPSDAASVTAASARMACASANQT